MSVRSTIDYRSLKVMYTLRATQVCVFLVGLSSSLGFLLIIVPTNSTLYFILHKPLS